jgi:hypothetical protein
MMHTCTNRCTRSANKIEPQRSSRVDNNMMAECACALALQAPAMRCKPKRLEVRGIDPRTYRSFVFDRMELSAKRSLYHLSYTPIGCFRCARFVYVYGLPLSR